MKAQIAIRHFTAIQLRRLVLDMRKHLTDYEFYKYVNHVAEKNDKSFTKEMRHRSHKITLLKHNTFICSAYVAIITIAHEQAKNGNYVDTRELMLHLFDFYPEEMKKLTEEKMQQKDKIAIGYVLRDAGFIRTSKRPKKGDERGNINVWTHGPLIKDYSLDAIIKRYESKDIEVSTDMFI